jgi:hypothetical protein
MNRIRVKDYKRKDPFLCCEAWGGRVVHLAVKVPYHQLTLCRQAVIQFGYTDDGTRWMCKTCVRLAGTR